MSVEIRTIEQPRGAAVPEDLRRAWETYVDRHPGGTFFHTLIWRDAVEEAFEHRCRCLYAWRDGRIVGVFPLTEIRSRIAGRILVSVPYAVYGGPLTDDDEAGRALLDHARRLAHRICAQWIDIRSIHPHWPELPVVRRYVTFRKRLPERPQDVLIEMPRKARAAARQARERHGLVARFDDDALDDVWSLYSLSMRRLGSLNYPSRFFRALIKRTRGDCPHFARTEDHSQFSRKLQTREKAGEIGTVPFSPAFSPEVLQPGHLVQVILYDDRPIAGLVSFIHRGVLMPYFAGCDERFERLHPNHFMYLTAMERGVTLGCRAFDFGRSRIDNHGAADFKRLQGFEPMPLNYQYYVPKGGKEPDLTPSHPKLALARRVWPRLPLAVTRPLGAWLSKSVPG